MATSMGGSSSRRRTWRTTQPTASPIAIPPITSTTIRADVSRSENVPPMAAPTAAR